MLFENRQRAANVLSSRSRSRLTHECALPGSHWYLPQLGVHRQHQGRGVGSAVLQPILMRADVEGLPCYLETEKLRNLPFYRRHGFDYGIGDTLEYDIIAAPGADTSRIKLAVEGNATTVIDRGRQGWQSADHSAGRRGGDAQAGHLSAKRGPEPDAGRRKVCAGEGRLDQKQMT